MKLWLGLNKNINAAIEYNVFPIWLVRKNTPES